MSKLPQVKPKKLLSCLIKAGFYIAYQTGSHCQLKHRDGRRVTVPIHNKDLKIGTIHNIMKQLLFNRETFLELLKL